MRILVRPRVFEGLVCVPPSKSHTIRRLFMASLCKGVSRIDEPLDSLDTRSCAEACQALGAEIREDRDQCGLRWIVRGCGPGGFKTSPLVDAGNSGTTLFFALAVAALGSSPVTFTGDEQTARRSAGPLLDALTGAGAEVWSRGGCVPITVCGPWKGGRIRMACPTSQYLSALLIAAPLAPPGTVTEIEVPLLNEKPYIDMTLAYLAAQGLYTTQGTSRISAAKDYSFFRIEGGAAYTPVDGPVPGDFSSGAFPAAAGVISGGKVILRGLDPGDTQGDKVFFDYLEQMGCEVRRGGPEGPEITLSRSGPLRGRTFDLNAAPDLLPVMAALGAHAEGTTVLTNAAHARIKETDRIAVMTEELGKLGIPCKEYPGGLEIRGRSGGKKPSGPVPLDGRGDHRVVMALGCAALGFPEGAELEGAEAVEITYPGFLSLIGGEPH